MFDAAMLVLTGSNPADALNIDASPILARTETVPGCFERVHFAEQLLCSLRNGPQLVPGPASHCYCARATGLCRCLIPLLRVICSVRALSSLGYDGERLDHTTMWHQSAQVGRTLFLKCTIPEVGLGDGHLYYTCSIADE